VFDHNLPAYILGSAGSSGGKDPACAWFVLIAVGFAVLIHLVRWLRKQGEDEQHTSVAPRRPLGRQAPGADVLERSDACRRFARERRAEFHPADPWDLPKKYADFPLFTVGLARQASNVIVADVGGSPVVLCDYEFKTSNDPDEAPRRFQVAVMELPIIAPPLEMQCEKPAAETASWAGDKDLLFENDEFNRRCRIGCGEPKFAYEIFHAALIRYLMSLGRRPNLAMLGQVMILYYDGRAGVDVFEQLMSVGRQVIESIQEDVLIRRAPAAPDEGRST